jgi:hypothetical protein
VAKELEMTSLAFNLGIVGDVHDNELTRVLVFDLNRVATAGKNHTRDFDVLA